MFLDKLAQFTEKISEPSMESKTGIMDELVKTIMFIQFTDEDACQYLFKVLHALECLMKRKSLEERFEVGELFFTNQRSRVFKSLKSKVNQFINKDVENSEIHKILSPESIMTLCLLYLENGKIDDKCHEKLNNVLQLACLDATTGKFLVWCFLSILKEGSAHGFKENTVACWPAWVPIRNFDEKKVNADSSGVVSKKIINILSELVWRYPLWKKPNFHQFWNMAKNYKRIPNLQDSFDRNGKCYIVDHMFDLLKNPQLSLEMVEDILEMIRVILARNQAEQSNTKWVDKSGKINNIAVRKLARFHLRAQLRELQKQSKFDLSKILDILKECLFFLEATKNIQEKNELVNSIETLCSMISNFGSQLELEKTCRFFEENFGTIDTLLVRYQDLGQLFAVASKIPNLGISFNAKLNYVSEIMESGNHNEMWQFFFNCLIHLRTEEKKKNVEKISETIEELYKTIVYDVTTSCKFMQFAQENRVIINAILCRYGFKGPVKFLYSVLHPSHIDFNSNVKNISVVIESMNDEVRHGLMSECVIRFNRESIEVQKKIAAVYLQLMCSHGYTDEKIREITEQRRETINQMLLLTSTHSFAKLFYLIFKSCSDLLDFDVRLKYFAKEQVELNEAERWELLFEIMPKLEDYKFKVGGTDASDLLSALELLIPILAPPNNDVNPVQEMVFNFAFKNKRILDNILLKTENFALFSRGALLSVLETEPASLSLDVISKYIPVWDGKVHEKFLWQTLGDCLHILMDDIRAATVAGKICKYLENMQIDEKLQSDFVALNHLVANNHIQKGNFCHRHILFHFLNSIPKLLSFETKRSIVNCMTLIELCDFLRDCFQLFEQLPKDMRDSVLTTIESACLSFNKDHIGAPDVDKLLCEVSAQYSKIIYEEILPMSEQNGYENLQILESRRRQRVANRVITGLNTKIRNLKLELDEWSTENVEILVDTTDPLTSSVQATSGYTASQWRRSFGIAYLDEGSGLQREWFEMMKREIFKPENGFFTKARNDVNRYVINKSANINPDYLKCFEFIGRFLAKGLLEETPLNYHFTKTLYEHILGVTVEYSDLESQRSIQAQIDALLFGFYFVIPKEQINQFTEEELELMLSRQSEVDIDVLKENTIYSGYGGSKDVIKWFWKALRSFDKNDKENFMMYTTGSKLFNIDKKFKLHRQRGEGRLTAHPILNRLDIPQYDSYNTLRAGLLRAIRETTDGGDRVY